MCYYCTGGGPVRLYEPLDVAVGEPDPEPEKGEVPDISPETAAERAEERIFEESLRKDRIASGYRTKIGDKK